MREATADGVIAIILGDSRRVIQVVDGREEPVDALVSVVLSLEDPVDYAGRVDEEFCRLEVVARRGGTNNERVGVNVSHCWLVTVRLIGAKEGLLAMPTSSPDEESR